MMRPTVAFSQDFFAELDALPADGQRHVRRFVSDFRRNPGDGWVYERIDKAQDQNFRLVAVNPESKTDESYWAVVLRPEKKKGKPVFVVLRVGSRESTQRWSRKHQCVIHPTTGALQVLPVEPIVTLVSPKPDPVKAELPVWTREEWMGLGVPEGFVDAVAAIQTHQELEDKKQVFPAEVYEAALGRIRGDSWFTVRKDLGIDEAQPEKVDPDDFDEALRKVISRQRFVTADNEAELEAILRAPLERWRVFLHPSQRKLVERHMRGSCRVLGGAGTGKTVVLMHRARHLAEKVFTGPHDKVLVTTYTTNLAADIENSLKNICSDEVFQKIEVASLDGWVKRFLRSMGYKKQVKYFVERSETELFSLWKEALETERPTEVDLPASFYREEWDEVVQFYGCTSEAQYLKVKRTGRGRRLKRKERKAIWPVFEEYRNLMADQNVCESHDAMRDAREILSNKGPILPYRAVLVDEAQDMSQEALRLLRQIVPLGDESSRDNDIFIVGDGHQKIYRKKVVVSRTGINIQGRSRRLKINYRTTDHIRKFAVSVLEGGSFDDLDGGQDDRSGYKSLLRGVKPEVRAAESLEEEIQSIIDFAKEGGLEQTCLVLRTKKLMETFERALNEKGIQTYRLRRSVAEDRGKKGLRVATMHRVKGLEFENIIVANATSGVLPLDEALLSIDDELVKKGALSAERALLYVSLTRARKRSLITYKGNPSPFLPVGTGENIA